MPQEHDTFDRRIDLFEKAISDELNEDERVSLEAMLRSSLDVRTEYRAYVAIHLELAAGVRLASARQIVCDEIRERASDSPILAIPQNLIPQNSSVDLTDSVLTDGVRAEAVCQSRQKALLAPRYAGDAKHRWLFTLAAILLVAVTLAQFWRTPAADSDRATRLTVADTNANTGVSIEDSGPASHRFRTDRPPEPVATIAQLEGVVWRNEPLVDGHTLREGDRVSFASGEARISVGFGAEISAAGPCSLVMLARDKMRLDHGNIVVHVAEWAKGFTIVTDVMDVVDLGTTFTVSASKDKQAETSVIKGLIRVHPHSAGESANRGLLVSAGEALVIDGEGLRQIKQQVPAATAEALELGSLVAYRPVDIHNTGFGFAVGDEDPHWRIVAGPAGGQGESTFEAEYASVCTPDERYMPNDRDSSQWVSVTDWREAKAESIYTFRTTFDLTGYDPSTVQLFGRMLADNGVQEVRVNGLPIRVDAWVDTVNGQRFGREQFRFVNVSDELVAGENDVEVDVWNDGMSLFRDKKLVKDYETPNPMALRLEWYAFGRKPEKVLAK